MFLKFALDCVHIRSKKISDYRMLGKCNVDAMLLGGGMSLSGK